MNNIVRSERRLIYFTDKNEEAMNAEEKKMNILLEY